MRPKLVKFCGITQSTDAQYCVDLGADALGFIFHPQSPRNLSIEQFRNLSGQIDFKGCIKVAVAVTPDQKLIESLISLEFEKFQFHFPLDLSKEEVKKWSELVGKENLWLAPKLKPSDHFPHDYLEEASTFLMDAYSEKSFGGTGQTADWGRFSNLKQEFPENLWVLAGGLSPTNLEEAILRNLPQGVDINSGVESAPGVKNTIKIDQIFSVLKKFTDPSGSI